MGFNKINLLTICLLLSALFGSAQFSLDKFEKQSVKIGISNIKHSGHPIDYTFINERREPLFFEPTLKLDTITNELREKSTTSEVIYNQLETIDSLALIYYNSPIKPAKVEGLTLINPEEVYLDDDDFTLPFSARFYQKLEHLDTVKMQGHNPERFQSQNISSISLSEHLKPFYLKNYEVTNEEYREFVNWVRDSIARNILAEEVSAEMFLLKVDGNKPRLNWEKEIIWDDPENREALSVMFLPEYERFYGKKTLDTRKLFYNYVQEGEQKTENIYPDTLCWINDCLFSYVEPMTNMYFWHPAYKDYPVVGISKVQAEAYCIWKTHQLEKEHGSRINVRLPKEHERESAILFSYEDRLNEFFINQVNDKSWITNLALTYGENQPQIDEKELKNGNRFNRENILKEELSTFGFADSDNNGFHFTTVADLSVISFKDFLKKCELRRYNEKFTKRDKTSLAFKYTELIKDLTPNNISGLAGNVSEWMFEDYKNNWNAVFHIRQLQLRLTEGEDASILGSIEDYYNYYCDKNGSLIRGGNWFDSRYSSYLGVNFSGMNTKTFRDPEKSYSTVGFRYVVEIND